MIRGTRVPPPLVKDGDLFATVRSMIRPREEGMVKVSEFKGTCGSSNDGADTPADLGRLSSRMVVISARRPLIRARRPLVRYHARPAQVHGCVSY